MELGGLMNGVFRILALFCLSIFSVSSLIGESTKNPSQYLKDKEWIELQDYLIPDDHPMLKKLDKIFQKRRVTQDVVSMVKAGFTFIQTNKAHKIFVCRHEQLPGYIVKAYLDNEGGTHAERMTTFDRHLLRRIRGSRLIKASIKAHHLESLFTVPTKWIYLLPDEPAPEKNFRRNLFIIIEDDVNIDPSIKWDDERVDETILTGLFTIMTEVGLGDVQPRNCPFTKEGKVAFIDTAGYEKPLKFHKMNDRFTPEMQKFWDELVRHYDPNKPTTFDSRLDF